jgi:hypothetical protein
MGWIAVLISVYAEHSSLSPADALCGAHGEGRNGEQSHGSDSFRHRTSSFARQHAEQIVQQFDGRSSVASSGSKLLSKRRDELNQR